MSGNEREVGPGGRAEQGPDPEASERRHALLSRVLRSLTSTPRTPHELLGALARDLVDAMADACGCWLAHDAAPLAATFLDEDADVTRAALHALGAESAALDPVIARVVEGGEPLLVGPGGLDALRDHSSPAMQAVLDAVRPHSVLIAPLRHERRSLGALWLARRASEPPFDVADLEIVELLGGHAALALRDAGLRDALRAADEERRRAESTASECKRQLHAVLEALPAGVIIADAAGRLLEWNAAAVDIWRGTVLSDSVAGYDRYVATWSGTDAPVGAEDWAMAVALRTGQRCDDQLVDIRRFDGGEGTILNSAAPIRDDDGNLTGAVAVFLDLTERTRAAKALEASERRFRFLTELLPEIVWSTTPDGTLDTLNQRGLDYFGVDAEQLASWAAMGHEGDGWMRYVHPDDRERAQIAWRGSVEDGRELRIELRLRRVDGAHRWCTGRAVPMREDGGPIIRWYGLFVDVDDEKHAEELAWQSRKTEDVARLAGGVAHEINNMMAVVLGFAGAHLATLAPDDPRALDLEAVIGSAERAVAVTNRLLTYSGQQVVRLVTLSPTRVLRELEPTLRDLVPAGIELAIRADPNTGAIRIDRSQLHEIVLELCHNAIDAMPDGGRLTIEIGPATFEPGREPRHPETEVTAGRHVLISVSDTGRGMDGETLLRMWDPFFTTKSRAEATGLGLATVYGIVKHARGYAWAYSELGIGTTVKVYLPQATSEPTAAPPPPVMVPQQTAATVLFVDDEAMLRALGERQLETNGFRAITAASAEEALAIVERECGRIDVVVTDLVMPGLTGRELGERLEVLCPGLPVLYVSGYTDDEVVRRGLLGAGKPFMAKPYAAADLADRVRELLASHAAQSPV